MRIAFVEWPEGLSADSSQWDRLKTLVAAARPDILLTNELPFGSWIAEGPVFSRSVADSSVRAHEQGLEALTEFNIPAIISSRPVLNGERLANEAFVLEKGAVRPLHRKHYFPNEPGWFESEWFANDGSGFEVADILGIKVGVLLCTEAMFNERARAYGRQKASLIVIPRATGAGIESWKIAGAMASLVSGAYVVSSNRVGDASGGTQFGGVGFAYAPHARLTSVTSSANPIQTLNLDLTVVASAQSDYPCYVPEL